jgi:selenocysteine-specific elongation factor
MTQGKAREFDRESHRFVHDDMVNKLTELLRYQLETFHRREPLRSGMNKEELFARLPRSVDVKLFNELLQWLAQRGEITQDKEVVRLSSHQVALAGEQERVRDTIENIYRQAGLQPPFFREAAKSLGVSDNEVRQILTWMLEQGLLVKVKEDMYFHQVVLEDLKKRLLEFFEGQEEITTPQFKELTQASRKYTIPLLEFLDATRFTIRVGDVRRLRQKGKTDGQ